MIDLDHGVVLKKIDEQDIDENIESLLELRNDIATALIILSRPLGQTREDVRAWIKRRNGLEGCIFFGVFKDRRLIGYVMFTEECRISSVGEISVTLHSKSRGAGIGEIALTGFMKYLGNSLDYRKFVARILDENDGSIRLFERCGFRLIGTMRRHRRFHHQYHDVRVYEFIIDERTDKKL